MHRRAPVPLILSAILFFGITGLSWFKLRSLGGWVQVMGIGAILGYLGWMFYETRVSLRDAKHASVRSDRWTAEVYAVSQGTTALTALLLESSWPILPEICATIGAIVFGGGVLLRSSAVRELGAFYSHRVRLTDRHAVVQTGPYKYLRHPAYAGMLLAHLGFVLVFFNLVSLVILLGAMLPTIILRIRVEERALAEVDGYLEFCHNRARLVPLVW